MGYNRGETVEVAWRHTRSKKCPRWAKNDITIISRMYTIQKLLTESESSETIAEREVLQTNITRASPALPIVIRRHLCLSLLSPPRGKFHPEWHRPAHDTEPGSILIHIRANLVKVEHKIQLANVIEEGI